MLSNVPALSIMLHSVKVCIIGAGVSGLKAAHTLLQDPNIKETDVIVLEAQARVGGRVLTDSSRSKLGVKYDFGAAWFHDALTNTVLYDSIADGTFNVDSDGYFDDKDLCVYSSETQGVLDVNELKLNRVVEDVERFIEIYYSTSLDTPDMSLDDIVQVYLEKYKQFLTKEQIHYCARMLRYMELWYGIPLRDISAKHCVMNHQGRNLYNKKGYGFVVDKLANQINCPVILNQQVTRVDRDLGERSRNHRITTSSGTTVHADYLVVTVPQSVLALEAEHEYGITWQPKLPKPLVDSLHSMHFGALGKVILEFDHVWWDDSQDRMEVLADKNILLDIPVLFQYPIYIVNYHRVHPQATSLVILIQDPVTQYLEANPHKAWEYMKPMMEKIKMKPVPEPINVLVTDWTQNPYARGSYSSVQVNDDPIDCIVQLSGEYDLCGLGGSSTIRFAGEHTIADGTGCVHGAYNSGTRAAEWILKNLTGKELKTHL